AVLVGVAQDRRLRAALDLPLLALLADEDEAIGLGAHAAAEVEGGGRPRPCGAGARLPRREAAEAQRLAPVTAGEAAHLVGVAARERRIDHHVERRIAAAGDDRRRSEEQRGSRENPHRWIFFWMIRRPPRAARVPR